MDAFESYGGAFGACCGGSCISYLMLLGIMFLPHTCCFHVNQCCTIVAFILFVFPLLVGLFFGGMVLNVANPAFFAVCGDYAPFALCPAAIVQFLNFGWTAFLVTNPVQRYLKYRFTEDVRDVGVCDTEAWKDAHGVYFTDGVLAAPDKSRALLSQRSTWVNIEHCSFVKTSKSGAGYWTSCDLAASPIYGASGADRVCTWAISEGTEPEKPSCGILGSNGLCGTVIGETLFMGTHSFIDFRDDTLAHQEFWSGLRRFAQNQSLTFDKKPPLLKLGSPLDAENEYFMYFWLSLVTFFFYIPVPLCCAASVGTAVNRAVMLSRDDEEEEVAEDPTEAC